MEFAKPPLRVEQQVALLAGRGLILCDASKAAGYLSRIGYYRFSAYAIPFESSRHVFVAGTTIEQVHNLYEFDRRFRLLMSEALEVVEIACRTVIATELAVRHDAFAHEQDSLFFDATKYAVWRQKLFEEIQRSKETFIDHYKQKYDGFPRLPIWMAAEVMSFGALSKLYANLKRVEQKKIAECFQLHRSVLQSWLHAFTYVRNLCAHHSRLWNRQLAISLIVPKCGEWDGINNRHVGVVVLALAMLLQRFAPSSEYAGNWQKRVGQLLHAFPLERDYRGYMGLPTEFPRHQLWLAGSDE